MKTKVYIDGQAGTTGLQIYERIGRREDLALLRIDEDKRHDLAERKKFLNNADIVFLCLPDAGAVEAVSLIDNPRTSVSSTLPQLTGPVMTGPTAIRNCPRTSAGPSLPANGSPIPAATPPA